MRIVSGSLMFTVKFFIVNLGFVRYFYLHLFYKTGLTVEQCYYLSDARCEDPLAPFVERDSELCTNIQVPEFKHDPRSVGIIFIIEGRGHVRRGFQIL
jgi:hypothetical protein